MPHGPFPQNLNTWVPFWYSVSDCGAEKIQQLNRDLMEDVLRWKASSPFRSTSNAPVCPRDSRQTLAPFESPIVDPWEDEGKCTIVGDLIMGIILAVALLAVATLPFSYSCIE